MMDRTVNARMRRYRLLVAFRMLVKCALTAGIPVSVLVELVESSAELAGDRYLIDPYTADLFEGNADRRYAAGEAV